MEITMSDVASAFEELIKGKKNRSEISDWAIKLEREWDERIHTVHPCSDAQLVYDSLDLLKAADYKNSPTEYFHDIQVFVDFFNLHVKSRVDR